jgi:hypothetical protein
VFTGADISDQILTSFHKLSGNIFDHQCCEIRVELSFSPLMDGVTRGAEALGLVLMDRTKR